MDDLTIQINSCVLSLAYVADDTVLGQLRSKVVFPRIANVNGLRLRFPPLAFFVPELRNMLMARLCDADQ